MSNAKRALGTVFQLGVTAIGELTEISAPELSAEEIEVTTLASTSGYREYIQGFLDSGSMSIKGYFYPGDSGQAALYAAYQAGTVCTFTITYPAASAVGSWTFEGFVTKYKGGDASISDPLTFEAEIRITGISTLGISASDDVTTIAAFKSDGSTGLTAAAQNPSWSASKYQYTVAYTTDTSFTIKATSATHTMKLYVDDVYLEDLTTAVASSAISNAAATVKIVKVVAYESGKTPKTYTFNMSRST